MMKTTCTSILDIVVPLLRDPSSERPLCDFNPKSYSSNERPLACIERPPFVWSKGYMVSHDRDY